MLKRTWMATTLVASMLLVACGGEDETTRNTAEDSSATTETAEPDILEFRVGLSGAPSPNQSIVFAARELGLYDKYGVEVTLENVGANFATAVAAGQVDVVASGASGAFAPTLEGRPMKLIYCWGSGSFVSSVFVAEGSEYQDVMDLSGQSVAVQGATGAAWGGANALSSYIVSEGGDPLDVLALPGRGAANPAVISGQVAAAIGSAANGVPELLAGEMRLLLAPDHPVLKSIIPDDVCTAAMYGQATLLEQNREAAVRFLAALIAAAPSLHDDAPQDLAALMLQASEFEGQTSEPLTLGFELLQPYLSRNDGFISPEAWEASLDVYETWALPVDVTRDEFTYENIVDMSYWDAAQELLGEDNDK